jgi:hypothetical protein
MRLAGPTREEMLAALDKVLGRVLIGPTVVVSEVLPPAAAEGLLQREINGRLTDALKLPLEQRLTEAHRTLESLRSLASNPLFAEVDRDLLVDIEGQTRVIEERLTQYALAQEHNWKRVKRRDVSWAAVGFVAVLDGPEPGPADLLALVLAGGMALFATKTVLVLRDPGLRRRQAEELSELLRRTQDRVLEIRVRPSPPTAPQPARPQPRTIDVSPPLEPDRRRRRACQSDWVTRRAGTSATNYHNKFAAEMVVEFKIPASPDMDYRITKGGLESTDYDSFDSETRTYWEFKTRHDYLPYDRPPKKWLAMSRIFAQAMDQRMTLVNCGLSGDIVWVFEEPHVATAAREYIAPWPVDRVIAQAMPKRKPIRSGGGSGSAP